MRVKFNGKKFRDERKKKNISQAQLAEMTDTSIRYVRDLENGIKNNPSASMVYQFSLTLDIPMETLMVKSEEKNK